jgi:isopenicillin N synthase-like dioxygenase
LANISADSASRKILAEQIRDACLNVGFFYGMYASILGYPVLIVLVAVKNHGIPENVLERALSGAKQFFSLPLDSKIEVCLSN